jgi:hypothetical protein
MQGYVKLKWYKICTLGKSEIGYPTDFLTDREPIFLYRLKTSVLEAIFRNIKQKASFTIEETEKNYR